jgi:hypothetical protein
MFKISGEIVFKTCSKLSDTNRKLIYLTNIPVSGIIYLAICTNICSGNINLLKIILCEKARSYSNILNKMIISIYITYKRIFYCPFPQTKFWPIAHTFCSNPKRKGCEDCSTHPSPSFAWWKSWQSFKVKRPKFKKKTPPSHLEGASLELW